ncbi:MAG: FAD/NAD(P)-binding protein [Pseudomonadota bacterium]|nr:FAD/NAD(P)-binding protein [Pseudomonadota bacterium]
MAPRTARIRSVTNELASGEVFTWTLEHTDGSALAGNPGQFNMLYAFGCGEVPVSISGRTPNGQLQHSIRTVGRVTDAMRTLTAGTEIGVRGPFGTAWPLDEAAGRDLVVVAGGLGLAPVRPLLQLAAADRIHCRKTLVCYGTRTPADRLYPDDLRRCAAHPRIEVRTTVDRGDTGWRGEVGVVPRLLLQGGFDPDHSVAVVCGPEIMMQFSVDALRQVGVADRWIYLSMERSMKCAVGLCGRCQWREHFICKDGPVYRLDQIADLLGISEL